MNEINNNGMFKNRTPVADMTRTDPTALDCANESRRHWFAAWAVTTACLFVVTITLTFVANQLADANARADVCLAAAKVDYVRVGEFMEPMGTRSFCYSDKDHDVCVLKNNRGEP